MAAIDNKYHLKIGNFGFVLATLARLGRHIYTREEAPSFVNKFASGDPNYRDATFFPHWVQLNWQNGFNQEYFDDGGKFFRSSQLDTTQETKLLLQKAFNSAGTIANAGARAFALRSASASNWWNTNYAYRQRLTITAPASVNVPVGHPVQVTIDTAALQTASKVRSDRKDWRIVYDNGTTQTDLTRHYVSTTSTLFATKAAITGGQTDDDYYVYYGYASESTDKQPSTDAEWNEVYVPETDASTIALVHAKEGTGTALTDTVGAIDGTLVNSVSWTSTGTKFGGFALDFGGASNDYLELANTNLDTLTIDFWVKMDSTGDDGYLFDYTVDTLKMWAQFVNGDGSIRVMAQGDTGDPQLTASAIIGDTNWHHIAITFDGTDTATLYKDGALVATMDFSGSGQANMIRSGNSRMRFGASFTGKMSNIRLSNAVRTSFPSVLTSEPTITTAGEVAQAAIATAGIFEVYVGDNSGKIYLWDGATTWTEVFDTRRIKSFDTVADGDTDYFIGDDAGTERAQAQKFRVDTTGKVRGIEVYIKKTTGTPGDITVRIETNNAGVPSGTLADSNATATITAFSTTSYGWVSVEFPASFTLNSATDYHLVLKTAAAANDNNYSWRADASSPSYSDGARSHSADGGSAWTADSAADFLFRIKAEATRVNQAAQVTLGGVPKLWFATGDPTTTTQANARLYTYDGSTWTLAKTFTGTGSCAALSLQVYNSALFCGLAPTASIQRTEDGTTWTESKNIDDPDNPGYPWDMEVYNQRLYVGGGHPEFAVTNNSQGFLWAFDDFSWTFVYDFGFTVIKSLRVFDGLLFIGTISKRLYVYNTASIDKLFEFPWEVSIDWMTVYDDKLAIGLNGTNSLTGQEAIYLFDRNGFHKAFIPTSQGVLGGISVRNQLLVGNTGTTIYTVSTNTYVSSGELQDSYFEAQLPNIPKLWHSITLMFDSMPTGCSIEAFYRTDETESWTSLGVADTVGATSETFNFPTGIYSNKLSIRVVFTTNVSTSTPVLRKRIVKYVLSPDFKYLWKMKLVCADEVEWLDGTEPAGIVGTAITANDTTLTLKSSDNATPTEGFPDPAGSTAYASVIDADTGAVDTFSYTGKTSTQLTGIPSSGTYALGSHAVGDIVKVRGADLHRVILDLKQSRRLFTLTDIDGLTYTVLFHAYQADNWVINLEDWGGIENEVPITLLQA